MAFASKKGWRRPTDVPSDRNDSDGGDASGTEASAPVITRTSELRAARSGKPKSARRTQGESPGFSRTSDRKRPQPSRRRVDEEGKPVKPKVSSTVYAATLLSKRDYSVAGMRDKLVRRGYDDEEADKAIALLSEHNYLSDERFAEHKSRGAEHRAGNARIAMTLRQKGIGEDLAKETIAQLAPESERVITASQRFRALVRKQGMTQSVRAKIYRFLSYRGFSGSAVSSAVKWLEQDARDHPDLELGEEDGGDDDDDVNDS